MPTPARPERPLYLQLSQRVAGLIHSGALKRGDRLTSVREAAAREGVSTATVVQAYRHLEDQRLVEARPKSGYFVAARPTLARRLPARSALATPPSLPTLTEPPAQSQPVTVNSLAERVLDASRDPALVSFGPAYPGGEFFANDKVKRALTRATQRHRDTLMHYPAPGGTPELREAVSRRALGMGCALDPRHIVITNGCLDAISLCLRAVTRPGDVVALESPTYFGFLQILETLHLRALEIPTHTREGLSLPALELALDTQPVRAVLAVPTLSNPLGATMPLAARKRLVQLLSQRGVPLIEDVIFNDLCGRNDGRRAAKSFDTAGHVMMCGSFTKTVSPGLRLGWVAAGRWSDDVRRLRSVLSGPSTAVTELALADALSQPGYEPGLRQARHTMALRFEEAHALIAAHFPPGTRVTHPPGGYLLWLDLPPGTDATALFDEALAQGITFAPGAMFSATRRYDDCMRLGLAGAWDDRTRAALQALGSLATQRWKRAQPHVKAA